MSELANQLQQVIIKGDLRRLSDEDKLIYYKKVCDSLGINPLTKPFDYITLNNKQTLYATKNCTDQLRSLHKISIAVTDRKIDNGLLTVVVQAEDSKGRKDSDMGFANVQGLRGENLGNAMLKAVTKAKRRVTLSICGLGGFLDETEVEDLPQRAVSKHNQGKMTPNTQDVLKVIDESNPPVYTLVLPGDKEKHHDSLETLAFTFNDLMLEIINDPDKDKKWLRSSLDGMTDETHTPCEAKHTHSANRLEVVGEYYMPQLQHYMLHTAKDEVYLSVIFGNNRHEYASIPADYTYQKKLIAVESWFIDHLVADKEPETLIADVPKKEAKDIVLNGMKQVDMSNNDKWTAFALQYTELKPVAKTFEEAKKSIKKLVPDDCYRAEGKGVIVTRNKKNILTIKEVNKDGE